MSRASWFRRRAAEKVRAEADAMLRKVVTASKSEAAS
jgi:hypothetical protein